MTEQMKGTKSPMNTGAFKRVFSVLVVLLLASALMVGAGSAEGEIYVSTYAELVSNLTDANADKTIVLDANIEAKAPILVNDSIIIEGQYHTISASGEFTTTCNGHSSPHLLCASEAATNGLAVTLKNVTFENNGKARGIQFLNSSASNGEEEITLVNVLVNGSAGSGITAKSVTLTATNLTVQNSNWGQSIDMQAQSLTDGVNVGTTLNLDSQTYNNGLKDGYKISCEDPTVAGTVNVENTATVATYGLFKTGDIYISGTKHANTYGFERLVWTTNGISDEYVAQVMNTTDAIPALHTDITEAISNYAADGATVTLLKDVTLSNTQLLINKKITLDGNGKKITGNTITGVMNFINVTEDGTIVKNLVVTDSTNVNQGSAITLHVYADNVVLKNNTITAGSSTAHRSQAIAVSGVGATIEGNTITLGVSGNSNTDNKQRNESIGIRFTDTAMALAGENTIKDNTIELSTGTTTGPYVGIMFDGMTAAATPSFVIENNTFNVGADGFVLETMSHLAGTPAVTLNIKFVDNEMDAGAWAYLAQDVSDDDTTLLSYSLTLNGDIYNNNFASAYANFYEKKAGVTFTDSAKWNTNPVALGENKEICDGQQYLAGNWWGTWSEAHMAPEGYVTLTTKDVDLPVADLAPLVRVGEPAKVVLEITGATGGTSTGVLCATLNGEPVECTWTVTDNTAGITTTSGSGDSFTYTGTQVGTATVTAEYTVNGNKITKSVVVTVYEDATPVAPSGTTVGEDTAGSTPETTITTQNGADMSVSSTDNAVILDAGAASIAIGFEKTPVQITNGYQGVVVSVVATYDPIVAPVTPNITTPVNVTLAIALNPETALVAGSGVALPTISPAIDDTVVGKITNTNYKVLSMFTASMTDLDNFNKNVTTVKVTFILDGDHSGKKFKIIHIGNGEEITPTTSKDANGNTVVSGVSNYGFSSYVLVQDNTKTETNNGGSSSSSSGSSTWASGESTQQPTETPTEEQPTDKPTDTVPTDIPGTQPTATPASPGFGILAALAGLGAVAVLRRQ